MREKIELTGLRFNRLIVIGKSSKRPYDNQEAMWECRCTCGNTCHVPGYFLRQKLKKSCGCLWKPHDQDYVSTLKFRLESNSLWQGQCQVWHGIVNRNGQGKTYLTPKTYILVDRLSWLIHIGKISKKKKIVHICGNPLCIRVQHMQVM